MLTGVRLLIVQVMRCRFPRARSLKPMTVTPHLIKIIMYTVQKELIISWCDHTSRLVIQNIMENAIKYGDGKQIEITFADEEDCRLIYISNTGCSINEEELPYLFDSFYRGSNSHNIKGSGLGLYICRQLMLKMDGEVFADINDNIFRVGVVVRKAK